MIKYKEINRNNFIVKVMTLVVLIATSCGKPFVKNPPDNHYFLYQNKIELKGGYKNKLEKSILVSKLSTQIDDSAKVNTSHKLIFFNILKKPYIFDTSHIVNSSENMIASLFHLGYYDATITYQLDTSGKKVFVKYNVATGKPTLISEVKYNFTESLNEYRQRFTKNSVLKTGQPVTKLLILSEVNRLVDSFRNNGFYKFTAAELKVVGDTNKIRTDSSIVKPDSMTATGPGNDTEIKIEINIRSENDSSRLTRYHIRKIDIFTDYSEGDQPGDSGIFVSQLPNYNLYYHRNQYQPEVFTNLILFKKGKIYAESDYFETIGNLTKNGSWKSTNIQFVESGPKNDSLDVFIYLSPTTKFRFETSLEMSYSASSNASNILAGNLFGLSGNISLLNRNLGKQGTRMTHNIRAGIEFNNRINAGSKLVNSNEIGYENTTAFPKLILAKIPHLFNKKNYQTSGETYINAGVAYNTRLNLFNLQTINTSFGWTGINQKKWRWSWSPVTIGFSNLFNQSDSFVNIVKSNPFLRYSYNTALVGGMNISFSKIITRSTGARNITKENSYRLNAEESGITWGLLPVFTNYKRRFIKADAEFKHTVKYNKSAIVFRSFLGVGLPLFKTDTVLPFFKQYFGGGSNSMRAWPVRGIGPGGKGLVPFTSNRTIFNDRTGDMQFEMNTEYRFDIGKIIPNTLTLRGAVFADVGNIWNIKNTNPDGSTDSSQFKFNNFYSQLGVAAGTGLRLDFNYFVIRLDLGFRIKRPELYYMNDGWKFPGIGFDDVFKKIFTKGTDNEYRKWRYENFNFTFGIGYAF